MHGTVSTPLISKVDAATGLNNSRSNGNRWLKTTKQFGLLITYHHLRNDKVDSGYKTVSTQ